MRSWTKIVDKFLIKVFMGDLCKCYGNSIACKVLKWYICRLEYPEGVETLLIALLYDAYYEERICTSVNLKRIVTKF